jgi:hypothetical protein
VNVFHIQKINLKGRKYPEKEIGKIKIYIEFVTEPNQKKKKKIYFK